MKGWVLLHRSIQDHWLWDSEEPFDKRSAWIDLLCMANHKDFKTERRGHLVQRKRGEVNTSVKYLSDRWRWSRNKVYRFLELLKEDGMIRTDGTPHGTTITIENYSKWQIDPTTDGTPHGTTDGTPHGTHDNKCIKNDKEEKKYIYIIREEFEKLWEEYPKKQGKKAALKSYEKARRNDAATYEQIKKGMEDYIAFVKAENRDLQYVKQGSTFFSQEAWKDDWSVKNGNNNFRGSDQGGGSMAGGTSAGEAGSFRFRDSD